MTQNVANLCVRCETRFHDWAVYHRHVVANDCKLKIVPLNTSGRSKAQIVADWESKQKGIIS